MTAKTFLPVTSRQQGVTLIELMIAVLILGIIAAVVYPTYTGYTTGARYTQVQSDLLAMAQSLERQRSMRLSYDATSTAGSVYSDQSPLDVKADDRDYTLAICQINSRRYVLRATPFATALKNTGTFYLLSDGRRGWDRDNDGQLGTGELCWENSCEPVTAPGDPCS